MSEEKLMEIEALGAIYMDSFQVINDDNIQITLLPNPSGEDNHGMIIIVAVIVINALMNAHTDSLTYDTTNDDDDDDDDDYTVGVILDIKYTADYPNSVPIIELIPTEKLTKDRIEGLISDVNNQATENIGTSMIFILAGTIKEWLDNNNTDLVEQEDDEAEESSSEEEEYVFEGTPVTIDTFKEWRKRFLAEMQPMKKEVAASKLNKLTGRQLFEIDSTLILSDSKFMEEGEETSNISASTVKPKLEDVAAQVDWSLFGNDDLPEDLDDIEEDN
ncbi:hypothetical protein SAMD00019534_066800 [Acytostelium subglobosum LB1]|uniref:hypothetical protein n=1 Tax=Acytostelium subglobosum LB1 TaxID=1410327 RepID=UPI000644E4A6|nr:hypothetical protein SAMD00019534_066800 [Acytostelium subglobosum LB1]GAM23505.1 hypothetical protein SAMD00019534_066800 [Acytostelium subglobosum LB1]|eukprot:XP_012753246.1 hypothetical protein SAMD00019534_066800 [Acytostelium subglobosum LB1]